MRRSLVPFAVPFVVLAVSANLAVAADWPQFRGAPAQVGSATESLPETPTLLWTYDTGDAVESTPAVVGSVVYFAASAGQIVALDLDTGSKRWSTTIDAGLKASPTVIGDALYIGDERGTLHALGIDGKPRWTFETGGEIHSSVNVVSDRLVFGSYDNHIYALERATGKLAWKVETGGYVHGTPAIADGGVVSGGCDGQLRWIDGTTGKIRGEAALGGYVAASPTVVGKQVLVGNFANQVVALELREGVARDDDPAAGPKVLWRFEDTERGFPYYSSGAVADGRFILGGRDKRVHAFDVATGKPLWTWNAAARVDSSPVIAAGRVWVGTQKGELVALDVATGEPRWRFETGAPVNGSPAIASGRILVGAVDGKLYCFGKER